jgi:hypothetical protein
MQLAVSIGSFASLRAKRSNPEATCGGACYIWIATAAKPPRDAASIWDFSPLLRILWKQPAARASSGKTHAINA